MNREQRRALMKQELDGGEVEAIDHDALDPVPPAPAAPVAAPVLTPEQIAAIAQVVAATMQAMPQPQGNVADAIHAALRNNRQPIPENTDADYHARSWFHPGGKNEPRPELAVETFFGVWDAEQRRAIPAFQLDEATLHDDEITAVNGMVPGTYAIERTDSGKSTLYVVDLKDGQDVVFRRVLAFPRSQFEKEHRNTIPSLVKLAQQIAA